MKNLNISLPESMGTYIDQQISIHGYGTASEYIQDLIRNDQKQKAKEDIETLLLQGLESGKATLMTEQDWLDIRQRVSQKLASVQQNKS